MEKSIEELEHQIIRLDCLVDALYDYIAKKQHHSDAGQIEFVKQRAARDANTFINAKIRKMRLKTR